MDRSLRHPVCAFPIFLLLTICTLTNFAYGRTPSLPLPSRVLYQFPNHTWVENIAVRSNGNLLVTILSTPDLYLIAGTTSNPTVTLVHSFPPYLGLFGIAELEHDIFYIVTGNFSTTFFNATLGASAIWEVDMRSFSRSGAGIRKVTDAAPTAFFNGVTALSKADGTILLADSGSGKVWKTNVKTGASSVTIADPTMLPISTAKLPLGTNGVKIHDGHLYYTSSNQGLLCRVPITTSGSATGPVEILAGGLQPDDFDVDSSGKAWIAQRTANLVSVVLLDGTVLTVLGETDQLTVAGATACVFGKSKVPEFGFGNRKGPVLHCTTGGGGDAPVNGTVTEGGKVVLLDTEGFRKYL